MVCPVEIILQSNRFNAQGYKVVEVTEMDSCTGCASCAKMCPDMCITVYKTTKAKKE